MTDDCLGQGVAYGGSSFAVTKGGRTFFVWGATTPEGSTDVPTFAASFDPSSGTVSAPSLVGVSPGANDTHNRPAVCIDSLGILHVVTGTHGTPTLHSYSLAPLTTDEGWSEPEPVLTTGWETATGESKGSQTNPGLVCDGDDTLHLVTRQWRRSAEQALLKQQYGALIHQSQPTGGAWSEPHTLALALDPGYCGFQHKITLDERNRLFVASTFVGDEDVWCTRSTLAEAMVLGRGSSGMVPSQRRMLLLSEDAGVSWRLASDADQGVAAPTATRSARSSAAQPRLACRRASHKPQGNQITAVRFVRNRYGWAVGTHGTILRSANGRVSWQRQSSGTTETLFAVSAVSSRVAWVAGQRGTLRRTLNGG